jgi:outer membrane cobalamin receptor
MQTIFSLFVTGVALGSLLTSAFGQSPPPSLEPVVVSAGKIPQKPESVGSSVSLLPREELDKTQTRRLQDAFRLVPGTVIVPSGQTGATAAPILRGANPNQTQIVVDGVRISDANIYPDVFLGGEDLGLVQSIEVLRGPQGALYGGEAIGGVIQVIAPRGSGSPQSSIDFLAGSFGTFGSRLSGSGSLESFDYSLSAGWSQTANDRPHNDFANLFQAVRLDFPLDASTTAGFTFRNSQRSYQSPGSILENDPDNAEEEEFLLITGYIDARMTNRWSSKLIAGRLQQDLGFIAPPAPASIVDHRKLVLDWRNTLTWNDHLTTLIGSGYEVRDMLNTGYGSVSASDALVSLYTDQTFSPVEPITLTAGGRWERYRSIGDALTWRTTAAWHLEKTGTTFRTSAGSGFRAPSFFELYANDPFFRGNPGLQPEESLGWDAGFSSKIGDCGTLTLTWFDNDISGLIVTDFAATPLSVLNLQSATNTGVEADFSGDWQDRLFYRIAYTYLQAEDADSGARLLRRPKHALGFDVHAPFGNRLTLGLGGQLIADRLDIDPASYQTIPGDSYFLGRAYASLRVTERCEAQVSVENLFDEPYDVIAGFPGRGTGVFGGFKLSF